MQFTLGLVLAVIGNVALSDRVPARPHAIVPQIGECDPENYAGRPRKEQSAIDRAYEKEPKMDEIRVMLRTSVDKAKIATMNAMLACKMPVALSNEGVLVADYGTHMGTISNFYLVARAYLLPVSDSTVLVRLVATEQSSGPMQTSQKPVTNKNQGKSSAVWLDIRSVAKQLLANAMLRPDWEQSTALNLVFVQRPQ